MNSSPGYTKEYTAYPGEYMPLPQSVAMLQQINERTGAKPLVNLEDDADCYRVELIIPGARREDIFINVDDNILSIIVLNMACENLQQGSRLHEFDSRSIQRHVFLPSNANTEFVSAEFRDGIVCLHIPKSPVHLAAGNQTIVVY